MGVGSDALRRARGPAPASGEDAATPSGERGRVRPAGDSVWLILAVVGVIAVGIALPLRRPLGPLGRRGPLGQHLPAAARRPAGGAPPRRRAAALLRAAPLLDGGVRHRQRGGPGALRVHRRPDADPGLVRRPSPRRAPRRGRAAAARLAVRRVGRVLLLAASPFAIRYATEARMYALVILLVFVGYLALLRVLDRPSWGRLLCSRSSPRCCSTRTTGRSRCWPSSGLWMLWLAVRGRDDQRRPARFAIGALVVGALTFIPWVSTFLEPGGATPARRGVASSARSSSTAEAVKSFGGNTHAVGWALLLMVLLAVFARASTAATSRSTSGPAGHPAGDRHRARDARRSGSRWRG